MERGEIKCKKNMTINIKWKGNTTEYEEELLEEGFNQACEMIQNGCVFGQLSTTLKNESGPIKFYGIWSILKDHTITIDISKGMASIEENIQIVQSQYGYEIVLRVNIYNEKRKGR